MSNYPPGVSASDIEAPQIVNREFEMTLTTGDSVAVHVLGTAVHPVVTVNFGDKSWLNANSVFDGDDWAKFWKIATKP